MATFIDRKLLQQTHLYIPSIIKSLNTLQCIFVIDETISNTFLIEAGASEETISIVDNISESTRFVLGDGHVFEELQLRYNQVHYTKYIDDKSSLCWIRSKRGSDLSALRRICLVDFCLFETEQETNFANPINVIFGDRGSGKTSYLRWAEEKIRKEENNAVVKFVNGLEIRRFLRQCEDPMSCDGSSFLNFLELEVNENLVLLVDDVDNMYKFETEGILKVIEDIHQNHTTIKVWVSCHSNYARDILEKTCGIFVSYLSPFTEDQRRKYLEEEIAGRDDLLTKSDSFIHGSLAIGGSWKWPSCFHVIDSNDCPNEESFTSLPLHLNFISKMDDVPQGLLCIYNNYISCKLEEFCTSDKDVLESCLTQLAMISLFEKAEEKFPMLRNVLAMLENRIASDWTDKMVCVDKKIVQFEHVNVRDFLASKWMANNYSTYRETFADCLGYGLCSNIFAMFFNRHLSEDFPLHVAVIDHNLNLAMEYLTPENSLVSTTDRGGRTPLHLAAISGAAEIAKALLDCDADPNAQDDVFIWTPLLYADMNSENAAVIEVLLKNGDSKNDLKFTNGASAAEIGRRLDKAIEHECINLIRHICDNCKRLRVTSKQVYEAIDCLEEDVCLETVLRVAEINPALVDKEYVCGSGYTALFLAAEKGYFKVIEYLAERLCYNMNARTTSGQTLLHVACEYGHKDIASYLLGKGADINSITESNVTPFAECCRNGYLEIAKMLHEAGADITINPANDTNLKIAAMAGHLEIVKFLLEEVGSERDILNSIFFMDNIDVIRALIKSGADVNCSDDDGCTPLHQAYGASIDLIKLLLNHGADCNALNNKEEPPLFSMCRAEDGVAKIKELIDYGADLFHTKNNGENIMHSAGSEVIPFLISSGIDVNSRTNTGETPLHMACADNESDFVETLLEHGADPAALTENGMTAMHYACSPPSCNRRIIELLVNAGADINAKTSDNERTPIFYALENGDCTNTLEILMELGADTQTRDISGRTPLHHACRLGYFECVKILTKDRDLDFINETDSEGSTPLHYALTEKIIEDHIYQRKNDIIVYLLEELNAKTDIANEEGKTAVDLIKENGKMRTYLKEKLMARFQEYVESTF